jgi:hypothetical protein
MKPAFPRAKYAVHRLADRGIHALARQGLDLRARRAAFVECDSAWPGTEFHQFEQPQDVAVQGPSIAIDSAPCGYKRLCASVTQGYSLSAAGILVLSAGRFQLPSGIVAVNGRFPSETIPLNGFPYSWQFLDAMRALWSPAKTVPDGYLLGLQLSHGYYHWVCEVLPRFVTEYLRIFGLEDRCVRLKRGVYRAQRLFVPTFPGGAEWPSPRHLHAVRARALGALDLRPHASRRLLISRADAIDRRVVNEDELLAGLGDVGFERVTLDDLSVKDQIQLFHQAQLIVAPHGAGTSNVLFAPRDSGLVELVGLSHYAACYMIVTSALGQRYGYVQCDERRRQLVVNVTDVRSAVHAILAPPSGALA